jgi:hypothetical protein
MQTTASNFPVIPGRLRISIVCFSSDEAQLKRTVITLLNASQLSLHHGRITAIDLFLVDNGPTAAERQKIESLIAATAEMARPSARISYCGSGHNIGFGAGHNLTFNATESEFHLVLNPDVELAAESLQAAFQFMDNHPDCGIIVPAFINQDGEPEYLCKRYPAVLDLLLRGFAPAWLRAIFEQRLAHYEMRDIVSDTIVWEPPLISGCFMLMRSSLLDQLKGFDPKYFLYFEDFDFSLRAGALTRLAYVPAVRVTHYGGYAAQKGWRHVWLFIRSAITFFNHYGWKWR